MYQWKHTYWKHFCREKLLIIIHLLKVSQIVSERGKGRIHEKDNNLDQNCMPQSFTLIYVHFFSLFSFTCWQFAGQLSQQHWPFSIENKTNHSEMFFVWQIIAISLTITATTTNETFRNGARRYFRFWSRLMSFWRIREYLKEINIRKEKNVMIFWYSSI